MTPSFKDRIAILLFGDLWFKFMGLRIVANSGLPCGQAAPLPAPLISSDEAIMAEAMPKLSGVEVDFFEPEDEAEKKKRSGDDDRGFFS